MARFYLSHSVEDYDKWRPIFDSDEERRKGAGLNTVGVYRKAGDENNLLVVFEGDNPQALRSMLASPELGEKMKQAGVLGPPVAFAGEKL
jgi:hypothetical protein